eukprot:3450055-Amphidinium_carterae.1
MDFICIISEGLNVLTPPVAALRPNFLGVTNCGWGTIRAGVGQVWGYTGAVFASLANAPLKETCGWAARWQMSHC